MCSGERDGIREVVTHSEKRGEKISLIVAACQHYKYWLCILLSLNFRSSSSLPRQRRGASREREETINSGSMCWSRVFDDQAKVGKVTVSLLCMFCPFRIRVISLSGSSSSSIFFLTSLFFHFVYLTSLFYSSPIGIPSNMKRRVISEILALYSLQMVVNTTSWWSLLFDPFSHPNLRSLFPLIILSPSPPFPSLASPLFSEYVSFSLLYSVWKFFSAKFGQWIDEIHCQEMGSFLSPSPPISHQFSPSVPPFNISFLSLFFLVTPFGWNDIFSCLSLSSPSFVPLIKEIRSV